MRIIHINEVKKVPNRPYTINLRGSLGHSNFNADLEGACLNINSAHPLSEDQVQVLEDELRKMFPKVLEGKIRKNDIDKVLNEHNGSISIKVWLDLIFKVQAIIHLLFKFVLLRFKL